MFWIEVEGESKRGGGEEGGSRGEAAGERLYVRRYIFVQFPKKEKWN